MVIDNSNSVSLFTCIVRADLDRMGWISDIDDLQFAFSYYVRIRLHYHDIGGRTPVLAHLKWASRVSNVDDAQTASEGSHVSVVTIDDHTFQYVIPIRS